MDGSSYDAVQMLRLVQFEHTADFQPVNDKFCAPPTLPMATASATTLYLLPNVPHATTFSKHTAFSYREGLFGVSDTRNNRCFQKRVACTTVLDRRQIRFRACWLQLQDDSPILLCV